MPDTFSMVCPACSKVGSSSRPIPQGAKVRCKCGHSFVPNPVEAEEDFLDLSPVVEAPPIDGDHVSVDDLEAGRDEDRMGVDREASLTDVWKVLNSIESTVLGLALRGPTETPAREYKVITQKDKWFSGKFDPEKVEGALNAYAKQGWTLKGVASASVPGFGGQRDELVIIMER